MNYITHQNLVSSLSKWDKVGSPLFTIRVHTYVPSVCPSSDPDWSPGCLSSLSLFWSVLDFMGNMPFLTISHTLLLFPFVAEGACSLTGDTFVSDDSSCLSLAEWEGLTSESPILHFPLGTGPGLPVGEISSSFSSMIRGWRMKFGSVLALDVMLEWSEWQLSSSLDSLLDWARSALIERWMMVRGWELADSWLSISDKDRRGLPSRSPGVEARAPVNRALSLYFTTKLNLIKLIYPGTMNTVIMNWCFSKIIFFTIWYCTFFLTWWLNILCIEYVHW